MERGGIFMAGLRKKGSPTAGGPLRVLVADEDAILRREMSALLVERYTPAVALEAGDVPSAIEALLVRHPDLVVADLSLSGHTQGGYRLILDAVSLGVPVVVVSGELSRPVAQRLAEFGVGWVQKGAKDSALFTAVERALSRTHAERPEVEARKPPSAPRMHTA
jgi:DNA-binding NarL/FixJ family response regulator